MLWTGAEWARYETTWAWLQWALRVLCPEHAPPEGTGVQVGVTMYQLNGAGRRVAHILIYAVVAALAVRAIQRGNPQLKLASLATAIGLGILYTGVDEGNRLFFQHNRHAKWTDLYLNLGGIGLTVGGTILYFALKNWEAKVVREEEAMGRPRTVDELLRRLDTSKLERDNALVRALVVINPGMEAVVQSRTLYKADFPIRRSVGAQPVTVFDETGSVIPSRLIRSELVEDRDLPEDRVRWVLELEIVVTVLGRHARTYGAMFGASSQSRSEEGAYWDRLPTVPLPVWETECRRGDLPLLYPLPEELEGLEEMFATDIMARNVVRSGEDRTA